MISHKSKAKLARLHCLLAGTAIASLLAVMPASAAPIDLGGYSGPITIKFQDYEAFTGQGGPVPGNQNFGVFEITSITGGGNILYQGPVGTPTMSDPLIVGVFSGIKVTGTSGSPPTENTYNTGGVFSLYDDTGQKFGVGGIAGQGLGGYTTGGCVAVDTQCYNGITNKGYDNILNLMLVPGANSSTTPATTGTGNGITSTLFAQIAVASPLTGSASGYADITGGTDAGQFGRGGETTGAGTAADIFFQDDFCASASGSCSGPISNWLLGSEDPITAAAVPEPGTLSLAGAGLLGLGFFSWRQRKRRAHSAG